MNNEIIVIKQLPVIVEQLQTIKADVKARTEKALSLLCNEETVVEVKKVRTTLNKEFADWEGKRKDVKKKVMSPYEQFETVYKDCITDVFKQADAELKTKIDAVENELKEKKKAEVKAYFDEYLLSKNIDFVTFENANINITMSASKKGLKEQAKAFIDRICDDLNLIDTQDHKDEIMYEYKKSLNVSGAITTVTTRYKAIEEQRAREEERKVRAEAEKQAVEKVEKVVDVLAPPTVEEPKEEKILTLKFTVRGTMPQLKALKEFLNNGRYDYE
jgi:hypothetical protein